MEIIYTPRFLRAFKKLPKDIKDRFAEKEDILKRKGFDPSLRIHKLHGKFNGAFSFSITYSHRVIMDRISDHEITLLFIGTHDIYH